MMQADRRTLRWILVGFFLALALPSVLLIRQAYGQLKWEALHQQQVLAEDLATRIAGDLTAWIATEDQRPVTDYDFLVVEGGEAANFLQRSPLSEFPVPTEVPGLIGYFQVDPAGRFSTPIVPPEGQAGEKFGITRDEIARRSAQAARLYDILSSNELVQHRTPVSPRAARENASDALMAAEPEEDDGNAATADKDVLKPQTQSSYAGSRVAEAKEEARAERPEHEEAAAGTRSFDDLQKSQTPAELRQQMPETLGRVADLKLDRVGEEAQEPAAAAQEPAPERRKRREANLVPEQEAGARRDATVNQFADYRINTFESEVDPLGFALLDGGQFVLFRYVWREAGRVVQGMLIEPGPFIEGLIVPAFRNAAVARSSDLLVALRGEVIRAVNGPTTRSYSGAGGALAGTLVHAARMPSPLEELELIFTVNQLPAGPGGRVLAWVGGILALVLCLGTWLLYRAGSRQLQLAEQQRDFVSAVSHELKTPLTSIRMYAEMLRAGWTDQEKVRTYYDYIHDESERLSRLISNVLQLSRITHKESRLDLQPMRGDELIDLVRSKLGAQAEAAGFELEIDQDGRAGEAEVLVDPDAFSQVMINLVDNAIKFSGCAETRRVELGFRRVDGQLQCSVRDHGPGIPRRQMKKIFRLFYRPESELTRETVGTGIGLALVQQLAGAMGGKVDVRNRQPGAEFTITLPCS